MSQSETEPLEVSPAPAAEEDPVANRPPLVPLRRNWRFQLLWIGASSTTLGVEAADIAYPLLVLAMTGSPALAGLFGFTQLIVILVLGLPIGALADRWDHRYVLIGAEGARAGATASVAVALAMDALTVAHLLLVALVLGLGTAFGGPVRMLLVRAVVPDEQLTQALTQDEVREGAAGLVGPAFGGALYGVSRVLPFIACAGTFSLSLLCALIVRVPPRGGKPVDADEPEDGGEPSPAEDSGGVLAGVRELVRQPALRGALLLIGTFYLVITAVTLVVVVKLQSQGTAPGAVGLALTGTAVGMLLGSPLVKPLHDWMAPGRLLLLVSVTVAVAMALLAVPFGSWWVFGVLVFSTLTTPALRVLIDIMILRQVPEDRRGRTIVATMTVLQSGPALGTMGAGLLLQFTGTTTAILALAALQGAVTLYGLTDRAVAQARWPQ
ncbi:MFS transporter [Wenjunlia tyrosinilytica]|uniref:MFS transporter n=1 Tax=Wenjunlia tyrosinilytica TaxID=1544741 RepID=A0A918E000_9ACTN|nr:MFS transporter [Wenjunlia tyrosinilytica]GGO95577.1 MFS transporter [Wenjunlia tyrosinilytica]